jgi:hypothetical protein
MTIEHSVLNAILSLEEAVQSKWINRSLILCPDESQCVTAGNILTAMDHMVEVITQKEIDSERDNYIKSIERLRNGLSRVLVTTREVLKTIQT